MTSMPLRLPYQHWIDRFGMPLSLILLVGIAIASLLPRGGLGDPGRIDLLAHLVGYAVATLPVALTSSVPRARTTLGILGWSAMIEVLQPLVGRTCSLRDLACNLAGVVIALALAESVKQMLGRADP